MGNVLVATFTMAKGLLKLFSLFEQLNDRVLLDLHHKSGSGQTETLELTNKFGSDTILEFIAAGPKSCEKDNIDV